MMARSELEVDPAVSDLLVRLRAAWDCGDGEAYASVFSDDAQYVTAPGEHCTDEKRLPTRIRKSSIQSSKEPRWAVATRRVRQITSDVVLVEATGSVLFPGEREEKVAPMACSRL